MSSISLDNAWFLLIALPLIILLLVPFFIAVRSDNRNGHNIASCALHVLMAVIIAFAAAGVTVETTLTETDVFVVADISYSANRNLDEIDGYIEDIQDNLPDNSEMGVVCFGKDQYMLTAMGGVFTSVKDAAGEVDDSQTDIASALEYAGARFRDGVIKRIVLITDAAQTGGDSDRLTQVVDRLKSENVHIDAIYLDDNITSDVAEVQVTGIEGGSTAYKGQDASLTVSVQSTQAVTATVKLYSVDGTAETELSSSTALLSAGTSSVEFTLPSDREAGTYGYRAEVEAEGDTNPYNNSATFTQQVADGIKVLFITGDRADRTEAMEIFDGMDNVEMTSYVTSMTTSVPYSVADICAYDIIVLSNVDVSKLDNYAMFIDSLEVAVSQLGKSLIAIGDLNLQNNADDEALTKLEGMLPVNYGNTARDQKLYALVIDCSYSMAISGRLIHAKDAAEAVIDLLNEDDYLYIVKFYSEVSSETYIGEVGDGTDAKQFIEDITTYQGTVISGGLTNILNNVASLDFSSKSVFLLTDGNNTSTADDEKVYETVRTLHNDYGITTSVISVELSTNTTAETFLKTVADYGGGSYFSYTYNISLDDILTDISNDIGETVFEGYAKTVSVAYKNQYDSVLDGVKASGALADGSLSLSYVEGFVLSSAKSSATTVLTASYTASGSTRASNVPIYSYWNYGNGGTAAFTSSISGDWVSQWISGGILQTFFTDVFTEAIPSERVETSYTVTVNKSSDSYSVEVTPAEVKSGATVDVTVSLADGEQTPQSLSVTFNSSSYTSSFSVDEVGTYAVTVEYSYKGNTETSVYYVDVSYLAEYDSFTLYEASLLYKIIGSDGTVSEDGAFEIVNDDSEITKQTTSLTIPLLVAAVVLFAADIIIRKLKWADVAGLFRRVDRGRKS